MRTFLGNIAPLPDVPDGEAHPVDIVFSLGRNRRFGGIAHPEWTGLHHSMLTALLYMRSYGTTGAEHALLHDCHEYVTGDIPSPVKALLGQEQVKALEDHLDGVIYKSLRVLRPGQFDSVLVKFCDLAALFIEAYYFEGGTYTFQHLGNQNWSKLALATQAAVARIIHASCFRVYRAMVESTMYNPLQKSDPWGL